MPCGVRRTNVYVSELYVGGVCVWCVCVGVGVGVGERFV